MSQTSGSHDLGQSSGNIRSRPPGSIRYPKTPRMPLSCWSSSCNPSVTIQELRCSWRPSSRTEPKNGQVDCWTLRRAGTPWNCTGPPSANALRKVRACWSYWTEYLPPASLGTPGWITVYEYQQKNNKHGRAAYRTGIWATPERIVLLKLLRRA